MVDPHRMADTVQTQAEDAKILTLARATRARTRAATGAAIRDLDGRTYAAADVNLESLQVSALDLAVAMAVSSGARGIEAAAVVSDNFTGSVDAVRDLGGAGVPIFVADATGVVVGELTS